MLRKGFHQNIPWIMWYTDLRHSGNLNLLKPISQPYLPKHVEACVLMPLKIVDSPNDSLETSRPHLTDVDKLRLSDLKLIHQCILG